MEGDFFMVGSGSGSTRAKIKNKVGLQSLNPGPIPYI